MQILIGDIFQAWRIGFAILATLSIVMIVIGYGPLVKSIYAGLLGVSIVIIVVVAKKKQTEIVVSVEIASAR